MVVKGALFFGCAATQEEKEKRPMNTNNSSNNYVNPNAKEAMKQFKMETAREVGVDLKEGYNGDLTSKQAGSIGGEMVRKMIKKYEETM